MKKQHGMITMGLAAVLAAASVLSFGGMAANAAGTGVKDISLYINDKDVTNIDCSVEKGKKVKIATEVTPKKAKKSVQFKSSNPKVASVSKKGLVTAKKKGTAKITVTVKGMDNKTKTASVKVEVIGKIIDNSPKVEELTIEDGSNKIYGKLYTPKKEGVYPAVILSHGYNGINADFVKECTYFAENGYIAYAFDFCGGSGRSKSSGKSTDMTIFTEKENLLAVFNHIKGMENVDSSRIFLLGGSQGGLVTALTAEEIADEVKAMVLYFPAFNIPDNWRGTYKTVEAIPETVDFWGLKLGKNFFASIHDFDPFENIGSYTGNVLIVYGNKDAIVPYNYVTRAKETYQNAELIVLENEGHGFSPAGGTKAMQEALAFMNEQ